MRRDFDCVEFFYLRNFTTRKMQYKNVLIGVNEISVNDHVRPYIRLMLIQVRRISESNLQHPPPHPFRTPTSDRPICKLLFCVEIEENQLQLFC